MAGKILFPLDFSPMSEAMLGCVGELSQAGFDDIVLAHVVEGSPFLGSGLHAKEEEGRGRLEEFAAKAAGSGLKVRTRLLTGHPASSVVKSAREEDVDLIYVGSHGWGYFHRLILGSNSDGIVRLADRPVLVYKCGIAEKERGFDCRQSCPRMLAHILVANDFSRYAERVKPVLELFAQSFCTRVSLLHVQEGFDTFGLEEETRTIAAKAEDKMEALVELGNEMGPYCKGVETYAVTGEPAPRILQMAADLGATMIVAGALGRHEGHGEMIGGVTERILRRSEVPVLVLR